MPPTARDAASATVKMLRESGFRAWWVGGAVRDILLGREPEEFDIATTATPPEAETVFEKHGRPCLLVGKQFGVIRVETGGYWFEVATLRTETGYGDHRHPDRVRYTADPAIDAQRRDFTVNAMFMDPETGDVLDFVGGVEDLAKRILRTVGPPEKRFAEDHLRKLRLARFTAQLSFEPDRSALEAVRNHPMLDVAPERISQEFSRLLTSESPEKGLRLLQETGLLTAFLPEAAALAGCLQPERFHPEGDVWSHTLLMFRKADKPLPLELALAILFHDIGKPPCREEKDGRIRFPSHDKRGAEIARAVLRRLRFPNDVIEKTAALVENHMRMKDAPAMRPAKLERLLADPLFPLHLELHRLDCLASHGKMAVYEFLSKRYAERNNRPRLPERFVSGRDLLDMGLPPGPIVGKILEELFDAQLEGRFRNRREALSEASRKVRAFLRKQSPPAPPSAD